MTRFAFDISMSHWLFFLLQCETEAPKSSNADNDQAFIVQANCSEIDIEKLCHSLSPRIIIHFGFETKVFAFWAMLFSIFNNFAQQSQGCVSFVQLKCQCTHSFVRIRMPVVAPWTWQTFHVRPAIAIKQLN